MENNRCSKKPWSDRKNRFKNFFQKTNDGFGLSDPDYLRSTFIRKTYIQANGRTEYEQTRFATQRITLLSVEGIL